MTTAIPTGATVTAPTLDSLIAAVRTTLRRIADLHHRLEDARDRRDAAIHAAVNAGITPAELARRLNGQATESKIRQAVRDHNLRNGGR